jgi:carbon monoxide dehydrogenase subunit G
MPDMSKFESRTGKLICTPPEIFDFVTDIRNFRQFVPDGTIDDLQIDKDSCSFNVTPLGRVNINLSEKEPHNKVVYSGNVLQSNDFSLVLNIKESNIGKAEVNLKLTAHLNPLLRMVAAKPINSFLEKLIDEMEKFKGWQSAKKREL